MRWVPPLAASCLPCLGARQHRFEVLTFRRSSRRRCEWSPCKMVMEAGDEEAVQDWVSAIAAGIEAAAAGRPK